jgi:predicted NUDIX family NTP pyrophosphohydrolase
MRRQACGVPVRLQDGRVEFCLVTGNNDSRWRFPLGAAAANEEGLQAALDELMDVAGLRGDVELEQPLDEFSASRVAEGDTVTAFLVRVQQERENGQDQRIRRRWCLPEEARMRIRRKPMRRLIDIALRRIEAVQRSDSGRGA